MQDTGRSPLHLLLDDRASRDGACGSDRRRRARGLARQPRTLRRQEDQGRPGKEGRHRVQKTHRQHHARTGHDKRVRAQTVRNARDAGRRGQAREPAGPAGPTATPHARIRRATLPMSASAEDGRTCAYLYFVKLRWTCSALNLNTVGVQLEHRRRLVPCFVVCLVYFMRECLFR